MRLIEKFRGLIMSKKTLFQIQKTAFSLKTLTKSRFIYLGFQKKSDAQRASTNCPLKSVAQTKKSIQSLHKPITSIKLIWKVQANLALKANLKIKTLWILKSFHMEIWNSKEFSKTRTKSIFLKCLLCQQLREKWWNLSNWKKSRKTLSLWLKTRA